MKSLHLTMPLDKIAKATVLLLSSFLVSCGGGSSTVAGIGGTGITSGEITAFGSVHMNGVIFDTDNSQFEVDGDIFDNQDDATQLGGLAEGMVAKVYGTTNGDGVTGTATLVEYDNDVEGPITNLSALLSDGRMSFDIFNHKVYIDPIDTTFKDTSFGALAEDIIVEVSGLNISDTEVAATFVKFKDTPAIGAEVEIEGIIDSVGTDTFIMGSVTIDYTANPEVDIKLPNGIPVEGILVEVHGSYQGFNIIEAVEIDEEDDDFGSDVDHISLEGIIANFTDEVILQFTINGQAVDAIGAVFYYSSEVEFTPTTELDDGVRIEVEGTIISGVLFADEVELH